MGDRLPGRLGQWTLETETIGLLLLPGFSLMTFASAVEPLRQANHLSGEALYDWRLLSLDGGPVSASSGAQIAVDASVYRRVKLARLLVCAGIGADEVDDDKLFARLRRLDRSGVKVGAIGTATYVLARADLLAGHRCTIHWESLAAFQDAFPDIDVRAKLYEIDRGRITCAGATACLDLMLHLIELRLGQELAGAVAQQFNLAHIRFADHEPLMPAPGRPSRFHPKLPAALSLMEAHLEVPLTLDQLAAAVGLSKRQLERVFRRHLGASVMQHYRMSRLRRARRLILQSSLSIAEIAAASGFVSPSGFARRYRQAFGRNPSDERHDARERLAG